MGLLSLPPDVLAARRSAKDGKANRENKGATKEVKEVLPLPPDEKRMPTADVNNWRVTVRRIYSQARNKIHQDDFSFRLPAVCTTPRSGGISPISEGSQPSRAASPDEAEAPASGSNPLAPVSVAINGLVAQHAHGSTAFHVKTPRFFEPDDLPEPEDLPAAGHPEMSITVTAAPRRRRYSKLQKTLFAVQSSTSECCKVRRATVAFQEVLEERYEREALERAELERQREHERAILQWKAEAVGQVAGILETVKREKKSLRMPTIEARRVVTDIEQMLGRLHTIRGSLSQNINNHEIALTSFNSNMEEVRRLVQRFEKSGQMSSEAVGKTIHAIDEAEADELPITKARTMPAPTSARLLDREELPRRSSQERPRRSSQESSRRSSREGQLSPHEFVNDAVSRHRSKRKSSLLRALHAPSNLAKLADSRQTTKDLSQVLSRHATQVLSRSNTLRRSRSGLGSSSMLSVTPTSPDGEGDDRLSPSSGDALPEFLGARRNSATMWRSTRIATKFLGQLRPVAPAAPEPGRLVCEASPPPELAEDGDASFEAWSPGLAPAPAPVAPPLPVLSELDLLVEPLEEVSAPSVPSAPSSPLSARWRLRQRTVSTTSLARLVPRTSAKEEPAMAMIMVSPSSGHAGDSAEGHAAEAQRRPPALDTPRAPHSPSSPRLHSCSQLTWPSTPRSSSAKPAPATPRTAADAKTTIEEILLARKQLGLRKRCLASPGDAPLWRRYCGGLEPIDSAEG